MADLTSADRAALRAEARDWLRRLHSGEATAVDAEALERWRARSPAHAREFADAALFWNVLGDAVGQAARDPMVATPAFRPDRLLGRRGFLIGGAALAASAAGVLAVRPPLALWPSVAELAADYRTGAGERRQIDVDNIAAVELNTRTSLDLRPPHEGDTRIELITGEAAVSTRGRVDRDLVVIAGDGQVAARDASFNIRKDHGSVSVSCTAGAVAVTCRDRTVTVRAGQQLGYDAQGVGETIAIDLEAITAWKRGLLIFRRAPLSRVIDEVNRYRSGRVILVDATLGQRQIVANFRLDRIEDVVDFMSKAMGIRVRSLPGGVVLVG